MGFIKEIYSNDRAGLVVAFGRGKNSENYFDGDSVEAAMKHFNMYIENNEIYIKTENEVALDTIGIQSADAPAIRSALDTMLASIPDDEVENVMVLFPQWKVDASYTINQRVRYGNNVYKVLQDHTSQADWTPKTAPSLFAALLVDEETGEILDWVQPNSTNGYMIGDRVYHNGYTWISTADNNVHEPGAIGAAWEKVIGEGIVQEWIAGSSYKIGTRVTFEGKIYESLIDNNVWSPTDYPAGWSEVVE